MHTNTSTTSGLLPMKKTPPSARKHVPPVLTLKRRKRKKIREYITPGLKKEITTLPNLITISRLVLLPLILYCLHLGTVKGHYFSAFFFLLAGVSDGLDGYLARKLGVITLLGKFLDPLADKLTTLSVMVYLAVMSFVPPWLLILMLSREFAVTGLRALAIGEGVVISASNSGKTKTAFQFVGLTFLLTHFSYSFLGTDIVLDYHKMGLYLLYLSFVMSLFSAFEYFALFVEAVEHKNMRHKRELESAAQEAGISLDASSDPQQTVYEEKTLEVEV